MRLEHHDDSDAYLNGLSAAQRELLTRVNKPGISALRTSLAGRDAIALLGAGVSAPLYPLWDDVINQLLDHAASWMDKNTIKDSRKLIRSQPEAVVELVRNGVGPAIYKQILRDIFYLRRDETTGLTWTPVQELIARSPFAGVVTTNYDPGIVNARIAVRPSASATGFASWADDDALDRWRTGEVFGDDELPVLFAHGHHNQPDKIVLATTDYRRAYGGKLGRVLRDIFLVRRIVWIGFSFSDQRITAILRSIGDESGSSFNPGQSPRHVAVLAWDPDSRRAPNPETMRRMVEIEFGCYAVFYPAPERDHSALARLLEPYAVTNSQITSMDITTGRNPNHEDDAIDSNPPHHISEPTEITQQWVHGGIPLESFIGRSEELSRLDRWAHDPQVKLIGVTAWGGAGKTALVTEWLRQRGGAELRAIRGVFAWSFYEANSVDQWVDRFLTWAEEDLQVSSEHEKPPDRILHIMANMPILLVLDGLEVLQEARQSAQFGRLLDGNLRIILTELCQLTHQGLVVLTSRFPFADIEQFDGGSARMLDVPPFTPAEGATLLENGGSWLPKQERLELVRAIDGHALAIGVLAGALSARPPAADLRALRNDLSEARITNARVARVLRFYANRLDPSDRSLISIVSLFQRPVSVDTIRTLGTHETFGGFMGAWTDRDVERAVRQRLTGLLAWYPDKLISAHPVVRDTFRSLILSPDTAKMASSVALSGLPEGEVVSVDDAMVITELIELLIDVDQWREADEMYQSRTRDGAIWKKFPAARLGQRCGAAFVATEQRQQACREELAPRRLSYYLNTVGLFGMYAGDFESSQPYLDASVEHCHAENRLAELAVSLCNLAECRLYRGDTEGACRASAHASLIVAQVDRAGAELVVADAYYAAALDLSGESARAEERFLAADHRMLLTRRVHLYSLWAVWWADFLIRTGRSSAARQLLEMDAIGRRSNLGRARSNRALARCDLVDNTEPKNLIAAKARLEFAANTFETGDYLHELADTLTDLGECHRLLGKLDEAEFFCSRATSIASPRDQIPAHAYALACRAQIRADRYAISRDSVDIEKARDDADAAFRLATNHCLLPWHELKAVNVHSALDSLSGTDHGFSDRLISLNTTMRPPNLVSDLFVSDDIEESPPASTESIAMNLASRDLNIGVSPTSAGSWSLPLYRKKMTPDGLERLARALRLKPSRRKRGGNRSPG